MMFNIQFVINLYNYYRMGLLLLAKKEYFNLLQDVAQDLEVCNNSCNNNDGCPRILNH